MEKKEAVTQFDFIETDKRILDQKVRRHEISQVENQRILKNAPDDRDSADELVVCKDAAQD